MDTNEGSSLDQISALHPGPEPAPRDRADRLAARIIGVLYLIGTAALIASFIVAGGAMAGPDPLAGIAAQPGAVTAGAMLILASGLALALVPVVFWPIGRRHGETLAMGYVVVRGAVETVLYLVSVLCWLLLVGFATRGQPGAGVQADLVLSLDALLWSTLIPIPFVLGALLFNVLLYRSRLVPRWLSAWGFAGAVLYLGGPIGALTGLPLGVLMAPLAVQEMVLAGYLIVKGFDPATAVAARVAPHRRQVAASAS
jgi:hypothetical protein